MILLATKYLGWELPPIVTELTSSGHFCVRVTLVSAGNTEMEGKTESLAPGAHRVGENAHRHKLVQCRVINGGCSD